MKPLVNLFITVGISVVFLSKADACGCHCVCPPLKPAGDLTDPAVLETSQGCVIQNLWSQPTPKLTENGERLRDIILRLGNSDVPRWRSAALSATIWSWSLFSQFDLKPCICNFARLVNATVHWNKTGKCCKLNPALDALTGAVSIGASLISASAIAKSGCCPDPEPAGTTAIQVAPPTCYKNGTVYLAKQIWKTYGFDYPCEYQKATIKVLCSNDYSDQVMGVFATLSISEPFFLLANSSRKDTMFQILTMLTTPELPKCCCKKFKEELKGLAAPIDNEADRLNSYIKSQLGCLDEPQG